MAQSPTNVSVVLAPEAVYGTEESVSSITKFIIS